MEREKKKKKEKHIPARISGQTCKLTPVVTGGGHEPRSVHPVGVAPLGVFVIFRVLLKRVTWPRGGKGGGHGTPSSRYRICTTRIHYCNPAVCVFCALFERERTRLRFLSMERAPSRLFAHLSSRLVVRAKRRPIIVP